MTWPPRTAGPIVWRGVVAVSLAGLEGALAIEWSDHVVRFADAGLPSWRRFGTAHDLHHQLGGAVPRRPPHHAERPAREPRYADIIGAGIDAETLGNSDLEQGVELAESLLAGLAAESTANLVVVIAPRASAGWGGDDVAFLDALIPRLAALGHAAVLCADTAAPALPPRWEVDRWRVAHEEDVAVDDDPTVFDVVPGVIDAATLAALRDRSGEQPVGRALAGGGVMIALERRPRDLDQARAAHDRLAVVAAAIPDLAAAAQLHGHAVHVDGELLADRSWCAFEAGATELALRLVEHAARCERRVLQRAIRAVQAQGIRIASGRFADAAHLADVAPGVPRELRGFLALTKGWGLIMSGDAAAGLRWLDQAGALLGELAARDRAYLDNIRALGLVRSGDLDGALALERAIAATIATLPEPDARLHYVNCLNTARIHMRRHAWNDADACLVRAFATTRGVRTLCDHVHGNLLAARCASGRGDAATAQVPRLRAALHWLASPVPEALTVRVLHALVGRGSATIDEVADALAEGLDVGGEATGALTFATPARLAPAAGDRVVGGPGWGVIVSDRALAPSIDGPGVRRLRARIAAWLIAHGGGELPTGATIIVDDQHGCELPATADEARDLAARHGIARVRYDRVDLAAGAGVAAVLSTTAAVAAIDRADDLVTIRFHRYRAPLALTGRDAQVVGLAEQGIAVADALARLDDRDRARDAIAALEQARVVAIRWRPVADGARP